ncbi:MAG: hypothetical protein A2Z87_12010 [Gallionellales bacterium GWA2_54_124]|nr:MAG: hypothetical protein A2Z87_12010 [Gallionellales bacterium GWA2_54_124]
MVFVGWVPGDNVGPYHAGKVIRRLAQLIGKMKGLNAGFGSKTDLIICPDIEGKGDDADAEHGQRQPEVYEEARLFSVRCMHGISIAFTISLLIRPE